jgi:leucyl/phenylalanyl-tRNA--protein transferase
MPIEPDPCAWGFPPATSAGSEDVVALGADLAPGTLLAAYRAGLFPMPVEEAPAMVWWSPYRRGVIPLDGFHLSRSLRRTRRRYEITVDRAFGWITGEIQAAYTVLHTLGWAHSVEAWDADGTLAGGLYGVEIGGLFAAESKFHVRTDASKAAVAGLVDRLRARGGERLLDVQWATDHLRTLGAVDIHRDEYLRRLCAALALPPALG